jgi:hypothetical protein
MGAGCGEQPLDSKRWGARQCAAIAGMMRAAVSDTEQTPIPGRAHLVGHVAEHRTGAVYVGRSNMRAGLAGSIFANPFPLTEFHRAECLRRYLDHALASGAILNGLPYLRGKMLDCWCRRSDAARSANNTCHADILVSLLDRLRNNDLAALHANVTAGQGTYLALGGSSLTIISAPELAAQIRRELGL